MKFFKVLRTTTCCVILLIMAVSCSQETVINKKVAVWYVYKDGSSFQDIEPQKELINSLSVFGNPTTAFIDECHQNNIEVYYAASGVEQTIDTPEKVASLVDHYLDLCHTKGYDGIDIDFEHLNPEIQDSYSDFLRLASNKLHAAGKKLSHCVSYYPALDQNAYTKMFYDPKVLATTCDLVRVMCYDMYFAPGIGKPELSEREDCIGIGPTSNYSWTKAAMTFWLKHIPKEQLVMALPAYANDYALSGEKRGRQIYQSVPDSVAGALPAPIWLCYERVNLYLYNHTNGNRHLFYASDARSTESLLELSDLMGISQIGYWHFSSVEPQMWDATKQWRQK